jgi:hypothetical protein
VHKEHPCTPSLTIEKRTRGASECGLAIFLKKKYLQAKIRIMETQIFHHAKNIISKKIL